MRLSTVSATTGRSAARHPISRWYVGPVAGRAARWLAPSRVRPAHLTVAGLVAAGGAVAVLSLWPTAGAGAAALVAVAWFFDRADGLLARYQLTASAWGAWLDANVDELIDVGLHVAVAAAAARLSESSLPWFLLLAFVAGKYLFFRGLALEEEVAGRTMGDASGTDDSAGGADDSAKESLPSREAHVAESSVSRSDKRFWRLHGPCLPLLRNTDDSPAEIRDMETSLAENRRCQPGLPHPSLPHPGQCKPGSWLRRCYHLPGNTDIRVHLLIAALLTGYLTAELAVVAVYYNVRWIVRYGLVARRLGGVE